MDRFPPTMTDKDFHLYRTLIYKRSGIQIQSSKKEFLEGRVSRRLKALKLTSFKAYYDLVEARGDEEVQLLLNSVCTHETHFFRDLRQFEFLEKKLIPSWKMKASAGLIPKKIRVWSAACSTGEEPYSLAMVLNTHFSPSQGWHVDILASDLSSDILSRAETGVWPIEKSKEIPERFLRIYMLKGTRSQEGKLKAGPEIKSLIRFEKINLVDKTDAINGSFELIFCRNVLIYFDQESRENAVRRILNTLSPEGFLFLGHSETLNSEKEPVRSVIPTVYGFASRVQRSIPS